jgi:lipopolysaccharide/colanic/teichoic acid biosynthesis glycosyltransferase
MDTFSIDFFRELGTIPFWLVSLKSFTYWFVLTFGATLFVVQVISRTVHSLHAEGHLRLSFFLVVATVLGVLIALNAAIFPVALYSILSGSFAAVLLETKFRFGWAEDNAKPTPEEEETVRQAHQGMKIRKRSWQKNVFDQLMAGFVSIIGAPFFLLLLIIVWFNDPGPLFIVKYAVGWGGKTFRAYKLRSMIKDAERETGAIQVRYKDARIIWIGHFLRASHLDEFPQLWNVLRGDMSLVGPRPEKVVRVKNFLQEVPGYAERHSVLPGITGWAQVHHTYYTPPAEKLMYDLYYIHHASLWFDLKILLKTLPISVSEDPATPMSS